VIDGLNVLYLTSAEESGWKRRRLDCDDSFVKLVMGACQSGQRVLMLTRHDVGGRSHSASWGELFSSFAIDGAKERSGGGQGRVKQPKTQYIQCVTTHAPCNLAVGIMLYRFACRCSASEFEPGGFAVFATPPGWEDDHFLLCAATCNMQREICNAQLARCNIRHATYNMQRSTCSMQRAAFNTQRTGKCTPCWKADMHSSQRYCRHALPNEVSRIADHRPVTTSSPHSCTSCLLHALQRGSRAATRGSTRAWLRASSAHS
jgi:hypothetical protein